MNLAEVIKNLERAGERMRKNVQSVAYTFVSPIILDLKKHSPKKTGTYQSNWELRKKSNASDEWLHYSFANNTPLYASAMEYGAAPGEAPWFFPKKNAKSDKFAITSRSGKLTVQDGRVWAGGVNPGHNLTIGGAIKPTIENNTARLEAIANKLGDALVEGLIHAK